MSVHRFGTQLATASFVLVAVTTLAHADAIDGDWCFATHNLNIQGAHIRTPGGTELAGDYSRHAFKYTAPASETDAGAFVAMQLLSEETMTLTRTTASGTASSQPEIWKRCKPTS